MKQIPQMTRNSLCPHFEKIWGFPLASSTTLTPLVSTFPIHFLSLQDNYGKVALHRACAGGHLECAKALLGAGADINKQANDGWTPLMYAAHFGLLEVVRELLKRGAKKDLKDNKGKTAYDWASNEEMRALLR